MCVDIAQLDMEDEDLLENDNCNNIIITAIEQTSIVCINVRGQDGTEVYFRIKQTSALKKLMGVYAQRKPARRGFYRIIYDGNPIAASQTTYVVHCRSDRANPETSVIMTCFDCVVMKSRTDLLTDCACCTVGHACGG